jgi:hypothetical protein
MKICKDYCCLYVLWDFLVNKSGGNRTGDLGGQSPSEINRSLNILVCSRVVTDNYVETKSLLPTIRKATDRIMMSWKRCALTVELPSDCHGTLCLGDQPLIPLVRLLYATRYRYCSLCNYLFNNHKLTNIHWALNCWSIAQHVYTIIWTSSGGYMCCVFSATGWYTISCTGIALKVKKVRKHYSMKIYWGVEV